MPTGSGIDWVIRPGIGLGDLLFGSSREDVWLQLGEPENVEEDLLNTGLISWYYWNLGVNAYFSEDADFRLDSLLVERADAELFGRRLIGKPEKEARAVIGSFDLGRGEEDVLEFSDHPALWTLSFPDRGLQFLFTQGCLEWMQCSCVIGPDDEFCWPSGG
jgi:hypothetical protein